MSWCEDENARRQGPYEGHRRDGSVRSLGQYRNGQKHGWWRELNPSGETTSEKEYRFGELVARRRLESKPEPLRASRPEDTVHPCPDGGVVVGSPPPNGHLQWCELERADGAFELHGKRIESWPAGHKRREESFDHGVPQGSWVSWHENGKKSREIEFEAGVKRRSTTLYRNGIPQLAQRYDADGNSIVHIKFYPKGEKQTESAMRNGQKHGVERSWWPNGQLREQGELIEGRKEGQWRLWSPDGRLASIEEYKDRIRVEDENFPAYPDHAPEWAPLPQVRSEIRAPDPKLTCPDGARVSKDTVRMGMAEMSNLAGAELDGAIESLANLMQFAVRRTESCVTGLLKPQKNGPAFFWHPEQDLLLASGEYRDDQQIGVWRGWGPDGRLRSEGTYREGKPYGRRVKWHWNGNTESVEIWTDGEKNGVFATWWPNGARRSIGRLKNGEWDGPRIYYKETGYRYELKEFRAGVEHGMEIQYLEDGSVREEKEYRDGVLHGRYANGSYGGVTLKRGEYLEGKVHGLWTVWRSSGVKQREQYFVNGVREGSYALYHSDGTLEKKGQFDRGRPVGHWTSFFPAGRPRAEGDYAWCEKPPQISITEFIELTGYGRSSHSISGCKTGEWTYWKLDGTLHGVTQHDEAPKAVVPASASSNTGYE
jgi:antitoxin component YwqK of YwqJK toxin-antitoxin module